MQLILVKESHRLATTKEKCLVLTAVQIRQLSDLTRGLVDHVKVAVPLVFVQVIICDAINNSMLVRVIQADPSKVPKGFRRHHVLRI